MWHADLGGFHVGSNAPKRRSIGLVVRGRVRARRLPARPGERGGPKAVKIGNPGPEVPGVGINSKATLAGPNCDATAQRIKIVFLTRPPCVTPWPDGKNNGGATAVGVTKDSVKVVVYAPTDAQNQAGPASGRAINRETGGPGDFSQSLKDWLAVYNNTAYETYGRTVDMEIVTPSGTDETSQHADALTVTSKKPFFVVDAIGQPVFAAAVAQSKTIVNSNTGTPDDWNKQAPYRWASVDADGTPFNGGEFVKKSLLGKPAQFAGDASLKTKTRKFAVVYPDTGVTVDLFTKQLPKSSYVTYPYNVPLDTAQITTSLQTQAATLIPKMKSDGITSVVLFGSTNARPPWPRPRRRRTSHPSGCCRELSVSTSASRPVGSTSRSGRTRSASGSCSRRSSGRR